MICTPWVKKKEGPGGLVIFQIFFDQKLIIFFSRPNMSFFGIHFQRPLFGLVALATALLAVVVEGRLAVYDGSGSDGNWNFLRLFSFEVLVRMHFYTWHSLSLTGGRKYSFSEWTNWESKIVKHICFRQHKPRPCCHLHYRDFQDWKKTP